MNKNDKTKPKDKPKGLPLAFTRNDLKKSLRDHAKEVHLQQKANFVLKTDSALPDAFVVAVISEGITEQYTLHKPIGVTKLNPDDWVMTRTEDVAYAMGRKVDPRKGLIESFNNELRLSLIASKGYLDVMQDPDGKKEFYYPGQKGTPRRDYVRDARALFNAKSVKEKEALGTWINCLPDSFQGHEKIIEAYLASDSFQSDFESQKQESKFETTVGIAESPQLAVPALRGAKKLGAVATCTSLIYKTIALGQNVTVVQEHSFNPPEEETPPDEAQFKDQIETLKKEISTLKKTLDKKEKIVTKYNEEFTSVTNEVESELNKLTEALNNSKNFLKEGDIEVTDHDTLKKGVNDMVDFLEKIVNASKSFLDGIDL